MVPPALAIIFLSNNTILSKHYSKLLKHYTTAMTQHIDTVQAHKTMG
jgi:hypothetical protein